MCSFAFPDDGSKSTYSQMSGSPRHPSNDTSMQQNVDLKNKDHNRNAIKFDVLNQQPTLQDRSY